MSIERDEDYINELEDKLAILEAKEKQYEEQNAELIQKIKKLEEEKSSWRQKATEAEAQLSLQQNSDSLKKDAEQAAEWKRELDAEKEKVEKLRKQNEELETELKKLKEKNNELKRTDSTLSNRSLSSSSMSSIKEVDGLRPSPKQEKYYNSIRKTLANEQLDECEDIEDARRGIEALWGDYEELTGFVNRQKKEIAFRVKKMEAATKSENRASVVKKSAEEAIGSLMGVIHNLQDRLEDMSVLGEEWAIKKRPPLYENADFLVLKDAPPNS